MFLLVLAMGTAAQATGTGDSPYAVITPENVAELEQIGVLGRGLTTQVAYLDDEVVTFSVDGTWRYNADNLSTPPSWRRPKLPSVGGRGARLPDPAQYISIYGSL